MLRSVCLLPLLVVVLLTPRPLPAATPPAPAPATKVYTSATIDKRIYLCYRSFWPELEMTAEFGKMGIDTRCFFAANAINSLGFEYCKYPLIWKGIRDYDFSAYDRQVDDLLRANPRAKFLCMIDLNTPYWLTRRFALDSFADVSHAAADPNWIKVTTQWMVDFIDYSEKKYGPKIEAYILSGGGTSEWYEYDRGRSSRIKNAAWRAWCAKQGLQLGDDVPGETTLGKAGHENVLYDPATEMPKIQYWRFHNEVIASAILEFAKVGRRKIPAGKELGVFFGYYLVSDTKLTSFGHLDYERVMASPDIDFFISPGTYNDRQMGGGSGPQLVHGTLLRYGKRYLHEIDHRTHVVPKQFGAGGSWRTQADDEAGLKREAAFALVNHASLWWFDMWAGWYREQETRNVIARMKKVSDKYVDDKSPSAAEALLIADPQSACYVNEKSPHAAAMARGFRDKLNKTGAPFDVYSFNDIPLIDLSRYKVVFLPATMLITPQRAEVLRSRLCRNGRTLVWTYAPGISDGRTLDAARVKQWSGVEYTTAGPATIDHGDWRSVYAFEYKTMTPTVLKRIMTEAGVHQYTDEENPVYCNGKLLAIHFKEGGRKTIHLPSKCRKVIDVLHDKIIAENVREFTYPFLSPDTAIFELVALGAEPGP
jgi:hypothetical protein